MSCCAEPNGQLAGVLVKVVEDTPTVYNLLVCTLCSCYPISILGTHLWKPRTSSKIALQLNCPFKPLQHTMVYPSVLDIWGEA